MNKNQKELAWMYKKKEYLERQIADDKEAEEKMFFQIGSADYWWNRKER